MLESGLLDNFKEIMSAMSASLRALLGNAVEQAGTSQSRAWCLQFPVQVTTCAARIHFFSVMEIELDNRAKGDSQAVGRLMQVQQSHVTDGVQMAQSRLG